MDPFSIKPLQRLPPEVKSVSEAAPSTAFVPRSSASAQDDERRTTRERGELCAQMQAELVPLTPASPEDVLVVHFEPLQMREGQMLVAAHVVGARLSELCANAEALRASRTRASLSAAQAEVAIELHADDALRGRALVHVQTGALGAMTIELRLERGRLDVHATVASAQAAEALTSDQALLERALRLQGIELGALSVEVERRRGPSKPRPSGERRGERDKKEGG